MAQKQGDREHDDDVSPEVQDDAEIETEEYPGTLIEREDNEPPDSVATDEGDGDHDDSI
jgi:hypothetical protein